MVEEFGDIGFEMASTSGAGLRVAGEKSPGLALKFSNSNSTCGELKA